MLFPVDAEEWLRFVSRVQQASAPRGDEGSPAAAMLQAFLRDLQQQRRPTTQVRRNQATETRGDVPGPRLASLLRGTSGAGGDRGKITPPVGTHMIKPQVPARESTELPDSSSVDTGSSPRPLPASRSPLLLPHHRKIREPSERLLTLAQPRRPVEPPGPIRTQLSQVEDKQVVALERIRQRQSLAEAAHYQRSGSEHSSSASPRAGLTQARLSQVSSPLGAKTSSRAQPSGTGVDRDRRSVVGSVQGTEPSHASAAWTPRVALRPRRTANGPGWLPYSRRKLREPSQRIIMLAQPRKAPPPPEETSEAKKKKMSESGSEVPSLQDKTVSPEERVKIRQSKAEAAHFGRATERAKLASRWRHAKEEKAAREAAAKARAKSYLGRASSFAAARQATQKALSTVASDRR
ncbi:uncharacterized protein LOC126195708 [Schistocerca nitens]|uniref:uncharacterized protein LOC126195708 n=1 Tax=Schistocerca nitens TaxID=7011 RepID=UPI0021173E07|nr:uncharacterized protein LOC126195708 [Schistocerca nitens]